MKKINVPMVITIVFIVSIMLIRMPFKKYYETRIKVYQTENCYMLKYGTRCTSYAYCNDKDLERFNMFKKKIFIEGILDFYSYDVLTGIVNDEYIYVARDVKNQKTLVIRYKNKQKLMKHTLEALKTKRLEISDYHKYRLTRFLFGYDKGLSYLVDLLYEVDKKGVGH